MDTILYFLAFLLDLIFKDKEIWPHPVRFIGKLLNQLEQISRNQKIVSLKTAGILSLIFSCAVVALVVFFFISLPIVGYIFRLYFAYAGLSLGGLIEKGREVVTSCKRGDIPLARKQLSYLVSRETRNMDKEDILKSVAETLSENFNDGFIAPLFYLLIGGPVLLWIYKTVSTMDSMWGYKTKEWKEIGWAGAKMDDLLGYIPARLSFFSIFLFYKIKSREKNILTKVKLAIKDAKKMESPNAGWPMAACAWVFNSMMGGKRIYFGKKISKPRIGGNMKWDVHKTQDLTNFLFWCGIFSCILFLAIRIIFI